MAEKKRVLKMCSWILAALVSACALVAWSSERLTGRPLSVYDFFPLLGLLAFSLMWTHYIVGSMRRYFSLDASVNRRYMKLTSIAVLVLMLLHPGLLNFQLNRDGFGSPPDSYAAVYATEVLWVITLGLIGLVIFLLFELKRWLGNKPWWRIVEYLQVVAMGFIFYHGLTLGRELSDGWYRVLWYVYGIILVASVVYNYWYDVRIKGGADGKR
jgi:hypothetical protein